MNVSGSKASIICPHMLTFNMCFILRLWQSQICLFRTTFLYPWLKGERSGCSKLTRFLIGAVYSALILFKNDDRDAKVKQNRKEEK